MPVHGAMSWGWLSPRGRVLARAGIGVLGWFIPPGLVDDAVGDGLAWEMRLRSLPARLGVYFVLGCALLSAEPYGEVMRQVTAGLDSALAAVGWRVPASTALSRARARIGEKPLESLFRRVCSALSPGRAPWSHLGALLVVAVDGTTISVPDSPANAAAFGRPGTGKKRRRPGDAGDGPERQAAVAAPQLRLVTLLACGTRALLDAAIGPVRGAGTGEQALARAVLGSLRPGMLLLADRNFYGYGLWNAAAGTGADLLWRVKSSLHLPVVAELPDGSFLAHVNDPRAVAARIRRNGDRRRRGSKLGPETGPLPGITVRVIQYVLTVTGQDGATRTERYRHLTTLTDWRAYPAADLAACYAWRWAIETGYRECKTYLRGPGRVLRGRTPALARQELWAYLAIYQAIRAIIVRAAAGAGLDPDRISFTATLHAAQRTMRCPGHLAAALAATETEILTSLIPQRQGRICPRAVNKPSSPYLSKHNHAGPLSQHATYAATIPAPARPARTSTD
ncbi:MAG TPA: IS4 family transposase, partial [Streptosporangiaceae bacterium]|nr:IS4 family transposase [Streptosporangiaceae bacterium]